MDILTASEVQKYINNYYIKSGEVYSRDNVLQIDEDTILKAKASRLIFNEAKTNYQKDLQQHGKTWKTRDQYILTEIKKYGLNGEINDWPQNKTIQNILNSNGDYEENYLGDTLNSERYGMLYGNKKDYGIAILKLHAKARGKNIELMDIEIDTTEFIKNGNSKVSILTKITPYKKTEHKQSNKLKELTVLRAKRKAILSIVGILSKDEIKEYAKRLDEAEEYDSALPIIKEINEKVKEDYKNKITDIDTYSYGQPYRFLCQSLGTNVLNWDESKGYYGNYISCSLLSNEQNDTYSGTIGFIYSPENIVAASSNDINLENRATNDLDVMRLQSIPTIDNVNQIISETQKKKKENNNENTYNEVGIRKSEPIAIFCKTDDQNSITYQDAKKLQSKYPHLKIIMLPTKTFTTSNKKDNEEEFQYKQSTTLKELEAKKQEAIKNNDYIAMQYYDNNIKNYLKKNPITISSETWNKMNNNQKTRFIELKIKESKILQDIDAFNYWQSVYSKEINKSLEKEQKSLKLTM